MKEIDKNTKFKVFGYVRRHEKASSISIATIIQYMIMVYLWINEQFTVHGDQIELDDTGKIATKKACRCYRMRLNRFTTIHTNNAGYQTVYGNNVIDINDTSIGGYKWTFKITRVDANVKEPLLIGIDASRDRKKNLAFTKQSLVMDTKYPYYAIDSNGWTNNSNRVSVRCEIAALCLDIDCNKYGTLSWEMYDRVLNRRMVIAYNINMNYHRYNLAISIATKRIKQIVELINFEIMHK